MEERNNTVYSVTSRIIKDIYAQLEYSAGKAKLARLRNFVGRNNAAELLSVFMEYLSEEFLGRTGRLSDEEAAILAALQLYAIHQQGETGCVHEQSERYINVGTALSLLRAKDGAEAADRRFNAMITTEVFEEFLVHLRYMVKLLKSRSEAVKLDYARLADHLYAYKHWPEGKENIRLTWSREYYRFRQEEGEKDEQQ